jgi:ankyrin repeat protein
MLELGSKSELMDDLRKTNLMIAYSNGHEVGATMLLTPTITSGLIDLQGTQYTRSELTWASVSGFSSVVKKLQEYGANICLTLTNRLGMTVLMLTCVHGKEETAKLLVASTHTADLIDLRITGFTCFEDGFSALMMMMPFN